MEFEERSARAQVAVWSRPGRTPCKARTLAFQSLVSDLQRTKDACTSDACTQTKEVAMSSKKETDPVQSSCDRRKFIALAAGLTATGGLASNLAPQDPPTGRRGGGQGRGRRGRGRGNQTPPPPPPNEIPPALQFQPYPGGTGAYLASLNGNIPNPAITVEPWVGDKPSTNEELAFLPTHRLAALIQSRKLSPVELTEIYLERCKKFDPTLMCVVNLMEDSARAEARQAEAEINAGNYRGPLHGIPWGVKDLFSTKGVPTTWGAKPFENRIIDEDAAVVSLLREAGAILIAKLSLGTFAQGDNWYRGRTRNPWNPEQGSSGSSAGPGSATAGGLVGFSIGTETQGSIVSPTRRCGITGLRPTYGRVSRYGGMTLAWSMDKAGPMCRTVEDCALVFHAVHGVDPRDPSTLTAPFVWERNPDLSKLKIGYDEGSDENLLQKLKDLGADPKPIGERPSSQGVSGLGTESAAAFEDFLAQGLDEQMERPQRVNGMRRGQEALALRYLQAQRHRWTLMQKMADFMEDWDMYISPRGDTGLTNQTGHPAIVFPYRFDEESGQPQCTTIIGDLYADDKILSVAHAYQNATEWHLKHPEMSWG
jgi:Asp-tRNA(Asn)/Glu-tRNA(Gln) amidotransferase A subunit family amidase